MAGQGPFPGALSQRGRGRWWWWCCRMVLTWRPRRMEQRRRDRRDGCSRLAASWSSSPSVHQCDGRDIDESVRKHRKEYDRRNRPYYCAPGFEIPWIHAYEAAAGTKPSTRVRARYLSGGEGHSRKSPETPLAKKPHTYELVWTLIKPDYIHLQVLLKCRYVLRWQDVHASFSGHNVCRSTVSILC